VPLIVPPGYGQVAFIFSGSVGTPPYVSTLGVDLGAVGGAFVAAANAIKSAWCTHLVNNQWDELALQMVSLQVGQDGGAGSVSSTTPPCPGTNNGAMAPLAMAVIARKVTNDLGRKGRGRMFIPGSVAESDVDAGGNVSSSLQGIWNADLEAFRLELENGVGAAPPTPPVLLHNGPELPTPIVGFQIAQKVGWIRDRI
jgi:hypothetical protein